MRKVLGTTRGPERAATGTGRLFEKRVHELGSRRTVSELHYAGKGLREILPGHTDEDSSNPHVAGRHEFVFPVSGKARIETPEETFELASGDLLLIQPGIDHEEVPAAKTVSYVLCWCVLDQSYATISHTSYTPAEKLLMAGPTIQLHGRTNVQSIAVAVGSELSNRAWGWHTAAQSLLRYLSCIMMRRIRLGRGEQLGPTESPTVAHDPAAWQVVQNALQHCRANFHHRVRVEDVARAVGYSASRLSHLFSSYIGQSIADHIRGLRMARARDLLESTDLTVSEVARRVGYGDPAHFSRAFKRSERMSPNAFRERLRGQ